jgi:pimeloyl-ACP methyl ester carboxylesterase
VRSIRNEICYTRALENSAAQITRIPQSNMKLLATILVICFGLTSTGLKAGWLEDVISKGKQTVKAWIADSDVEVPELSVDELQAYPEHYRFNRVVEPFNQSPIFYFQAGLKNKPPILLIHGLGEAASKDWLNVIPELEKEFHVFALDLPGFGLSKGQYFEYSPQNYSQIINWFITSKIQQTPILVGHSMGGAISLYYAASYPETISQLVLIDAAGILERTSYIKQLAEIPDLSNHGPKTWSQLNSNIRNFSDKWVEKSGEMYDPTKILHENKLLRQLLLADQGGLNAALAMIDTDYSQLDFQRLPKTLMIWGEKDVIAPLRTGKALVAKIPTVALKVIANAGHVPMNSHAKQFNQLLIAGIGTNFSEDVNASEQTVVNSKQSTESNSDRIAHCKNDDTSQFSGNYFSLNLDNCKLAVLSNVKVKNFSSKNSIVNITNSEIGNLSSSIEINSSAINATASKFYGMLITDRSRLDFAGVELHSEQEILTATDTTKLVFSISGVVSKNYTGRLHGYYSLGEGSLDQYLSKD